MARRSSQKRRPGQILFLILSILVVISMALGYLLYWVAPEPPPPTPTPTHTPQVSSAAPVHLASQIVPEPATWGADWS